MRQCKAHIRPYTKLRSSAVVENQLIAIHIREARPLSKEACLPEHSRIRGKAPVRVQEQVAWVAAEYRIFKQEFSIAIAIEVEGSEDGGDAELISLRYVVQELSLDIGKVQDWRIVGKLVLVIDAANQITRITFSPSYQIRTFFTCDRTIDHSGNAA